MPAAITAKLETKFIGMKLSVPMTLATPLV